MKITLKPLNNGAELIFNKIVILHNVTEKSYI